MSWDDAKDYCESHYEGLARCAAPPPPPAAPFARGLFVFVDHGMAARHISLTRRRVLVRRSIHNKNEQKDAVDACKGMELSKVWDSSDTGFDANSKHPVGCWIGLADTTAETAFSWSDGSRMDYSAWSPGEPTEGHHAATNANGDAALAALEGEDAVHMTFVKKSAAGGSRTHWDDEQGSWNDNHKNGEHGHNENNAFGMYPICQTRKPDPPTPGAHGSQAFAFYTKQNSESCDGKYVAIPRPLSWEDASHYCVSHGYYDLASIHSWQDQASAVAACKKLAGSSGDPTTAGSIPHGCWIGMHDSKTENAFEYSDATYVNYHAWAPGEPNSWGRTTSNGNGGRTERTDGTGYDENYVEMDFRPAGWAGASEGGAWNDAPNTGTGGTERLTINAGHSQSMTGGEDAHGQCFGCYNVYGLYPLCERAPPADSPTQVSAATVGLGCDRCRL